jgi:hypothetical protein
MKKWERKLFKALRKWRRDQARRLPQPSFSEIVAQVFEANAPHIIANNQKTIALLQRWKSQV